MRAALMDIGLQELASGPMSALVDLHHSPPRKPWIRPSQHKRGWKRFCHAKEQRELLLMRRCIRLFGNDL